MPSFAVTFLHKTKNFTYINIKQDKQKFNTRTAENEASAPQESRGSSRFFGVDFGLNIELTQVAEL